MVSFSGTIGKPIKMRGNFYGTAGKVVDGDTFYLHRPFRTDIKVRIFGADALELKQNRGREAREYLKWLLSGRLIKLVLRGGSYDRTVAEVYTLTLIGWRNVGARLIGAGYAVIDNDYAKNCKQLQRGKLWSMLTFNWLSDSPKKFRAK